MHRAPSQSFISFQPAEISVCRDREGKQLCLIQSLNQTVPHLRSSQESPKSCKPESATSSPQAMPLRTQTKQNCVVIILGSSAPANPAMTAVIGGDQKPVGLHWCSSTFWHPSCCCDCPADVKNNIPNSSSCRNLVAGFIHKTQFQQLCRCCSPKIPLLFLFRSRPALAGFHSEPEVLLELTDLQRVQNLGLSKHSDCPELEIGFWSRCNLCFPPSPGISLLPLLTRHTQTKKENGAGKMEGKTQTRKTSFLFHPTTDRIPSFLFHLLLLCITSAKMNSDHSHTPLSAPLKHQDDKPGSNRHPEQF